MPPPHIAVADCIADLESFLHDDRDDLPVLIKAALAHVQFETIHPFLDGNGRVGRLLITLLLCNAGVLSEPLLYLSLYFKQNRAEYYGLLDSVRSDGEWEEWIAFFLRGVEETANGAVSTARRLVAVFAADRELIQGQGRRAGSALRVCEALTSRPVLTLPRAAQRTGLSFPGASDGMKLLGELGIVSELTEEAQPRVCLRRLPRTARAKARRSSCPSRSPSLGAKGRSGPCAVMRRASCAARSRRSQAA